MPLPATYTADELASIEACRHLIIEFGSLIDAGRTHELGQLMVADASFARPTMPEVIIHGIDEILNAFAARPKDLVTQHLNLNIRITLTGQDTATGESIVAMYRASANDPLESGKGRKAIGPLIGTWSDTFVRTPQGWRFKDRRGNATMYV
ncbi:MAG: nuclear transport factor 2 family protein [Nevskiaceae bacterium]|nr:nuclear transport factor 2 family protein [Nevskiaceae bacterium]